MWLPSARERIGDHRMKPAITGPASEPMEKQLVLEKRYIFVRFNETSYNHGMASIFKIFRNLDESWRNSIQLHNARLIGVLLNA